tara:strand:+ start:14842 stop:15777 length:936 start_codon:yes stop_codon:yes gene_type:complete
MKQKQYCIVGFGKHAQSKIIPAVKKSNGKIVGVVSSKISIDNEYRLFSSLSKALLRVASDTIFILCTPPNLHYSQALEIINHEHNVFIEKPITINVVQLEEIIKVSNVKKIFFVENFMHEYSQLYSNFINIWNLEKNNIKKIDIEFTLPKLPENTFRHKNNNYPVNLYDIGSYAISLINNLSNGTSYKIINILNKGQIDNEKFMLISKVHLAEVNISFGINDSYKNFVTITKVDERQYKFEPFFFGREGYRSLQEIYGKNISDSSIYDQDCFKALFEKSNKYWIDTQETRNRAMLNNLSSLENLSKQYNSV